MFQILTANKSVIKQLDTVRLGVIHSIHTHTFLFYVVSNKCCPMQLGLLSFNCRISEDWEWTSDLQYYYKDDYMKFCFDSCEEQWGSTLDNDKLISSSCFNMSFQVLVDSNLTCDIKLSEKTIPVQKPDWSVPVSLNGMFEDAIHSMEWQGIISKLDRNTATEWLNSFVIVKKPNGDLRICLDLTDLNKYIVRPVSNSNTLDKSTSSSGIQNTFLCLTQQGASFSLTKWYFQTSYNHVDSSWCLCFQCPNYAFIKCKWPVWNLPSGNYQKALLEVSTLQMIY